MSSRARLVVLAALCAGALLVGVELMITAVALPRIVVDIADWTQLRRASWIVNGYLLAYIAMMPLAGRAGDRYGIARLYMLALIVFAVGSILCGLAPDMDTLIAARVVQGLGGGAILPLATAGASHLYAGDARARALGIVGACTFLGMALGPFVGATALEVFDLEAALRDAHLTALEDALAPSWRWVFYLGAPLAIAALSWVWAASARWRIPRASGALDWVGAALFTVTLAGGLIALTTLGEPRAPGDLPVPLIAAIVGLAAGLLFVRRATRTTEPFFDLRLFRHRTFSGAMLLSLLTGYALATVIIGAAVWVDRVRYAGPAEQRLVLGTLAVAMALGALVAGFLLRRTGVVALSLVGLGGSVAGLVVLGTSDPETARSTLLAGLALFGIGFGLTVTPRSTAAVESLGRAAFGVASAGVTVARMAGMAIGLAVLTGFGTSRIEALSVVLTDADARDAVLPVELRGRPLEDLSVVAALESWAAAQAAGILGGLFLVAGAVTLVGVVPTLMMGGSTPAPGRATMAPDETRTEGDDGTEPALAL
jgi:MFS family permease